MTFSSRENYIPLNDIPVQSQTAGKSFDWYLSDSEEMYRRRQNDGVIHPYYSERDVSYRCNSYGYRSSEFTEKAEVKILSLGCSNVFGVGVAQQDLFHERFAQYLRNTTGKTVCNFNLGWPGASNDCIQRMLYLAYPVLKPDIILINFTCPCRREYVSVHGRLLYYRPLPSEKLIDDPLLLDLYRHFFFLTSARDDQLNFFRAYKGIEAFLRGTQWIYSVTDVQDLVMLKGHLDQSRCAGVLLMPGEDDKARDFGHPGKLVHERLYGEYVEVYNHLSKVK